MLVLLGFAFLSGVVTILSPCILPVLPVVLATSARGGRARPFGVITGFIVSFTVFTLSLTAIVQVLGVPADALRIVAVVLIVAAGTLMLVPRLRDGFELLAGRLANRGTPRVSAGAEGSGFLGGVPVGLGLGLVWTPCVGPIMASVISLALTARVDGGAVLITLAYTVGTSIPMLAVMVGGRALLNKVPGLSRNMATVQRVFGVLMIAVGLSIGFGWDRRIQTALLEAFPGYGAGLTAIESAAAVQQALLAREDSPAPPPGAGPVSPTGSLFTGANEEPAKGVLGDYGMAPELVTDGAWFNTAGRTFDMEELRGKVVLVDFWTYSCVNCVRTLPWLRAWYDAYGEQGLVIVGVHSPEFEFEKSAANLERAIAELRVTWPVVQDNYFAQWRAYGNRYWPAHYFIDAQGRVRYYHFGEGDYDTAERIIQELLREAGSSARGKVSGPEERNTARTPETYLGYERSRGFTSAVAPVLDVATVYQPARTPGAGEWNLEGPWTIAGQYVVPAPSGALQLAFDARKVFLVIEIEEPGGRIEVRVDGELAADTPDVSAGVLAPTESRLYQLVGLNRPGQHVLHLQVQGKLRLFAFTFG